MNRRRPPSPPPKRPSAPAGPTPQRPGGERAPDRGADRSSADRSSADRPGRGPSPERYEPAPKPVGEPLPRAWGDPFQRDAPPPPARAPAGADKKRPAPGRSARDDDSDEGEDFADDDSAEGDVDANAKHPKGPHPRHQNDPELKVAGKNACRALFAARPDDIRRAYIVEEELPEFKDVLRELAQRRIAYHVKTSADLTQIAATMHHDGVVFLARERAQPTVPQLLALCERKAALNESLLLVVLEDVKNPHNLGAILRVCAHFGVHAVLAAGETPALSAAAMRTAEGGAEHVDVIPVGDGRGILETLRGLGFSVVATSSHTPLTVDAVAMQGRVVVMFGSEGEGLSAGLVQKATHRVQIPGSGALESLNVACAASVVLWEAWRRRPPPRR